MVKNTWRTMLLTIRIRRGVKYSWTSPTWRKKKHICNSFWRTPDYHGPKFWQCPYLQDILELCGISSEQSYVQHALGQGLLGGIAVGVQAALWWYGDGYYIYIYKFSFRPLVILYNSILMRVLTLMYKLQISGLLDKHLFNPLLPL